MSDRFDLEQQISNLLNVCDDIDLVTSNILDGNLSTDDIANVLIGIRCLLKLKHDQLFDTMTQVLKLDKYNGKTTLI